MRKLKILAHISLDGVVQHEDGEGFMHGNWTAPYRTPAGLAAVVEAQGSHFDLLLGRRTYDAWALAVVLGQRGKDTQHWPPGGRSRIDAQVRDNEADLARVQLRYQLHKLSTVAAQLVQAGDGHGIARPEHSQQVVEPRPLTFS